MLCCCWAGGIVGWASKGSVPSLVAGLGSAGVISICSYASLQQYHAGEQALARAAAAAAVNASVGCGPRNFSQDCQQQIVAQASVHGPRARPFQQQQQPTQPPLLPCPLPTGKPCKPATAVSLLVAAGLTYGMYQRYASSGKFMPAGMVAGLSAAMTGEWQGETGEQWWL